MKLVDARQHVADKADASRRQRAAGQVKRRMEFVLFSMTVVLELKSANHPSASGNFGQLFSYGYLLLYAASLEVRKPTRTILKVGTPHARLSQTPVSLYRFHPANTATKCVASPCSATGVDPIFGSGQPFSTFLDSKITRISAARLSRSETLEKPDHSVRKS